MIPVLITEVRARRLRWGLRSGHPPEPYAMDPVPSTRAHSPHLDAINLMLRDLHTRHDEIRHRAAFRGCTNELLTLQQELVNYLLDKKHSLLGLNPTQHDSIPNYNSFT